MRVLNARRWENLPVISETVRDRPTVTMDHYVYRYPSDPCRVDDIEQPWNEELGHLPAYLHTYAQMAQYSRESDLEPPSPAR